MTYIEAPRSTDQAGEDRLLAKSLADGSEPELQKRLYLRYRRPLMQVFLQRRIDRDAAEDLLQRTFLRAVVKIRTDGLDDPSKLGGYLYRTAIGLAKMYWRGGKSRQYDSDPELITNIRDESLSLEERLDKEQLASCVRELMRSLAVERDREVLERYYLREEARTSILESLELTDLQLNQVLWRARQRFGDILRRHGLGPRSGRPTGKSCEV